MKIVALKYGETTLPESMVFFDGDSCRRVPISMTFYLLEWDGYRVLVDPGCDSLEGFVFRSFCSPLVLLEEYGVSADSVTDVIVTHAHHDHIEGVKYFKNARIHIQRTEYEKGKQYLTSAREVAVFDEETVIGGALLVRRIGGHTLNSCVVEWKQDEVTWVIAGDECYVKECLETGRPTGAFRCAENSLAFVRTYAQPHYRVLLCHDPDTLPQGIGWQTVIE